MSDNLLNVRVRSVRSEAEDINSYELVDRDDGPLPAFAAGAHIDVHLSGDRIRQYSLCNDPRERHRYVIGVLKESAGRGGSLAIFETLHEGTLLTISPPRNLFPLTPASRYLLLAGGIGITPMLAMLAQLEQENADFFLHYCTRSVQRTPFLDFLANSAASGRVKLHHDGGDPKKGLDVASLLSSQPHGTHLYYCGPPGFMAAITSACAHWPRESLHFEYFTANRPRADTTPTAAPDSVVFAGSGSTGSNDVATGFRIRIKSTGALYEVPNDKSIVAVLREHGVEVATSCESGLCGTCRTRYVEGDPEHHDYVLTDDERDRYVMICCARSSSPILVLDL